jgi:hypothetical protein
MMGFAKELNPSYDRLQSAPDGRAIRFRRVQSLVKIFGFSEIEISVISLAIPSHSEGLRNVIGAGCGGR